MADELAKEIRHLADVLERLAPAVGLLEELLALLTDAQSEPLFEEDSHGSD